jgi:Holliday junction resolvase
VRLRAKVDRNHSEIVEALRKAGASVQSLAQLGKGVPDLLVGWKGRNFVFEVKDPKRRPSHRRLTEDEIAWHCAWTGQVAAVETVEAILEILESA